MGCAVSSARDAAHELVDGAFDAIDESGAENGDKILYTALVGLLTSGPDVDNMEQYETAFNHFFNVGLRVLTEETEQ